MPSDLARWHFPLQLRLSYYGMEMALQAPRLRLHNSFPPQPSHGSHNYNTLSWIRSGKK